MAGKAVTRGSARVAYALDRLSKNALIDVVLDLVQAEVGEDATDEQLLARIQSTVDTILRLRSDRPVNLQKAAELWDKSAAKYREELHRRGVENAVQQEIDRGGD